MTEIKELSINGQRAKQKIIDEIVRLNNSHNYLIDELEEIAVRLAQQGLVLANHIYDREEVIRAFTEAFWSFFPDNESMELYKWRRKIEDDKLRQSHELSPSIKLTDSQFDIKQFLFD